MRIDKTEAIKECRTARDAWSGQGPVRMSRAAYFTIPSVARSAQGDSSFPSFLKMTPNGTSLVPVEFS